VKIPYVIDNQIHPDARDQKKVTGYFVWGTRPASRRGGAARCARNDTEERKRARPLRMLDRDLAEAIEF